MWRELQDCIVKIFRSRKPSADIKAKDARTDRIIADVRRESEQVNDRIERLTRQLVDEVRG